MTTVPASRMMRKRPRPPLPVTGSSVALFRLGEICNNACPMCSNSGRPDAYQIADDELLRRVAWLRAQGFLRVVVTGGEPTVHPGFASVVQALQAAGIAWDINTHGRSFADATFCENAVKWGLERAIVSLHSHDPAASAVISGVAERGHAQTVAGIENLVANDVVVMLNLVVSGLNVAHLSEWVSFCYARFGTAVSLKLVFPYTGGRGGDWAPIQLRYSDVRHAVVRARDAARRLGMTALFESFPLCVLGDPDARNLGRSGFGETHYLEDLRGRELYTMRTIEASLSVYGEQCRSCAAMTRCGGVSEGYGRAFGTDELRPFVR